MAVRSTFFLRPIALVALAFVACDSPFEPRGEGERVPIGQIIDDSVSSDAVRRYSVAAEADEEYVVYLEALSGNVSLIVTDSQSQSSIAFVSASPGGPGIRENASNNFLGGTEGRIYHLTAHAVPVGASAQFRFLVYRVNRNPERRLPFFLLGDTVSGETIDPQVDADEFVVHGSADQYWVAAVQALGPAGSGAVGLVVWGASDQQIVGVADAVAGAPAVTTGRTFFPTTQDYRFTFRAITSNLYPRYTGPYRFWTYLINRFPEHRSGTIAFNTEIAGESIDRPGDLDEFTFQATAGTEFNVFLQSARQFQQLEVLTPGKQSIAALTNDAPDTALFARATGRFRLTTSGQHIIRVSGTQSQQLDDTGSYRFFVYQVDPRPEHRSADIAPGDTVVGEEIDRPGDADEFTFLGAPGQEYKVFLQAQNGSPETRLQLVVLDPVGTLQALTLSSGNDSSLLTQGTGRFTLTSAGTYTVRVTGEFSSIRDLGPYRLFVYRVNRNPETAPQTLSLGDSVIGEAIDVPGDVDEYTVVVADTVGVELVGQVDAAPEAGTTLVMHLRTSGDSALAGLSAATAPTEAGRVKLGPGTYIVRVDVTHWADRPKFRGTYRLWLYRFAFTPEQRADTFAIGETITQEVIAPWGDVDRFHFYGLAGQHINVALQGQGSTGQGFQAWGFQAWISGPGGEPIWTFASVSSSVSDATLRDHQTTRLDLPVTGWYHVEMTGFGSTQGAYRLLVELLSPAPETAASTLVPGDSVTTEALDALGDWDEFTVSAPPGSDIGIIVHGTTAPPYTTIRILHSDTQDTLSGTVTQGERVLGPIMVPSTGRVRIAVFEPASFVRFCYDATCAGIFRLLGPYGFRVIAINRAPENTAASYTVGDTVRGEAIDPLGDVDEFMAVGTPGERLTPEFRLTADPVPFGGLISLHIVDPASGVILAGGGAAVFRSDPAFFSPGTFIVPSSGAFIVRMQSGGFALPEMEHGTAPYEFVVRR